MNRTQKMHNPEKELTSRLEQTILKRKQIQSLLEAFEEYASSYSSYLLQIGDTLYSGKYANQLQANQEQLYHYQNRLSSEISNTVELIRREELIIEEKLDKAINLNRTGKL